MDLSENVASAEMGIYCDNSSAIVIGGIFLPIIVIGQNSLDSSITDIAFVIFLLLLLNYRDKRFFMHTVFQGQRRRGSQRGPAPPIDMLGPPINMLTLLKTAVFVLNFKLWPP